MIRGGDNYYRQIVANNKVDNYFSLATLSSEAVVPIINEFGELIDYQHLFSLMSVLLVVMPLGFVQILLKMNHLNLLKLKT